ncbi:RNA polymerase sigma factor [Flavobacterium mekongense]|uniref:RNA polymerase sigma factor n=1 Tax=Flavobacterium mekongense TaxID=3379707 RepID=UPI003999F1DA
MELFEYMSWKSEFLEEAQDSFREFVARFESYVLQKAEVYCLNFGFNETIAEDIANCTFARVWKYPKFKLSKAKGLTVETSIKSYLNRIIYTQIVNYKRDNYCAEPTDDEDLTIVENYDDFIDRFEVEDKNQIKQKYDFINSALENLTEKHRIIFFTYKVYERDGKNLPANIRNQLKETLNLTQGSIRRYKSDAIEAIRNYIDQRNGK